MSDTESDLDELIDRVLQYYRMLPQYKTRRLGRFEIVKETIPAGTPIRITSMRQQLYEGLKSTNLKLDTTIPLYKLKDSAYGTWMSTSLQEIAQMDEPIRNLKGKVLVGGLGLGVIAHLLLFQEQVNEVTVVEREKDLIKLVQPFISGAVNIICTDLFDYLKQIDVNKYDSAFFDIWQRTGEWTWQTQVVPLLRLAHHKIKTIRCWQEKEMTGQMVNMLYRIADISPEWMWRNGASIQHYWVFRKGIEKEFPNNRIDKNTEFFTVCAIENENSNNPRLQELVDLYLNKVATPEWEERFGKYWDESQILFREQNG